MRLDALIPAALFPAALLLTLLSTTGRAQRLDWKAKSVTSSKSVLRPGAKVTIKMEIENPGILRTPVVLASVVVARNALGTDCPTKIGTLSFPELGWGEKYEATAVFDLPVKLPAGSCFVVGTVNPAKRHSELTYANNVARVSVSAVGKADLVATKITVPQQSIGTGTPTPVTTEVTNESCVDAPPSSVRIYLSSDNVPDVSDWRVGTQNPKPIAADEAVERTANIWVPTHVKAGRYWLIMIADDGFDVVESDETNNARAATVEVYVVGSYTSFDAACAGSVRPPVHDAKTVGPRSDPHVGATTSFSMKDGVERSAAIFALGFSKVLWGSILLPFDVTGLGAPGCRLVVSPDVIVPTSTDHAGIASVPMPWPNDVNLVGAQVYTQYWSHDPNANALGFAFTQGLETKLGSQK